VLDLFDKRFALYEELREVIGRYGGHGPNLKDIGKFAQATSRTRFLFGPEVTSYLNDRVQDLNREFVARNKHPVSIPEKGLQVAVEEYTARLNRLTDFFKEFDVLVAPYMKHTQKRFPIPYLDA